jgi:hypothetical protein
MRCNPDKFSSKFQSDIFMYRVFVNQHHCNDANIMYLSSLLGHSNIRSFSVAISASATHDMVSTLMFHFDAI